ncbi:MAG: hypothetical protein RJQ10_12015 [Haliea sp.]|uniref:hypothetical protein n=1 Tax=Haliea sp. TaxID=1932666 RepID=UPI0032ED84FF
MTADDDKLNGLLEKLDEATALLAKARDFAKPGKLPRVLDTARRVMLHPHGCAAMAPRARAIEEAGVFAGSDWASPQILVPALTPHSLGSADANTVVIEALSELRLLAVAHGEYRHPLISAEQAHHYLTQVIAINLTLLFGPATEAERETQGRLAQLPRNLFQYLTERIGYEHVIDQLIEEIWRILEQRPIQVDALKSMITQIATCQADPNIDLGASGQGANRLVSALFSPTRGCQEDPGIAAYRERLGSMDPSALQSEATGFARAMHDTGLVSPYHPVLLRFLLDHRPPADRGPGPVRYRARLPALLPRSGARPDPRLRASTHGAGHLRPGAAAGARHPLSALGGAGAAAPAWPAVVRLVPGATDTGLRRCRLAPGKTAGRRALHAGAAAGRGPGQQPHLPVGPGPVDVGLQRPGLPAADGGLGGAG